MEKDMKIDPIFILAIQLFKNGIRFQYLKYTGKPGRPQALSLEITHNCIARCIMCNIWKIPQEVQDISIEDWTSLLTSGLFSDLRELDITGGEPFLRKDLLDFFKAVSDLKHNNLKNLKSIAITTNGFLTGRVLEYTEKIARILMEKNMDLVMVCAMDAIGEIHDRIRNHKDAWAKVDKTIKGLKRIREKFPNLIMGLKTTILPINVRELEKIVLYANSHGLFTIISPFIITEGRYLNPDLADGLAFSKEDIQEMITFYKRDTFKWSFHGKTLVKYFKTGVTKKPCSCGFNYLFIRSTGDLYLCPLINIPMGNIRETPVTDIFFSKKASQVRHEIGTFPECRQCTEPGLERYALPYEGFTYLSLLLKMGREEFLQLHHHMGLDKY
ncbi:MAG: radical SAM protein [Thermodesulfobacteriota bacterium]|nr:radical SAM protein [Thermodesulfobacteriota bacterium]